jgi:ABC-type lipoprotein release transport system permease subunit
VRGYRGTGPLIWQRLISTWRLLLVLAFGMLVAATLLATSPVYTRVMNDLGLESSLRERLGIDNRTTAIQVRQPFGSAETAQEAAALRDILQDEVGWFSNAEIRYGSLGNLVYTREGFPPTDFPLRPLIQMQAMSGAENHLNVMSGRFARVATTTEGLEAVIPAESARVFHLEPGDRIVGLLTFNDCNTLPPTNDPAEIQARARFRCVPGTFLTISATLTVAGIVEQADPNDGFWSSGRLSFIAPVETETEGPVLQALLPEESFYGVLPRLLPSVPSVVQISAIADLEKLDSASLPRVRDSVASARQRLEEHGALADTPLTQALGDFNQRASFNQVTLLLLLLQVVGIALYYVLLVASLLVERRSEEIAMLRSRGASVLQVVGLSAAEAGFLAVIVAVIAPFLASGLVALLGLTSTFENVSGGGLLPYKVVPASFLLGLGGALLAAVAVIVPAFFTARQSMVQFLRGNARPGKPFLQRYYLDFGLAGLAALALWQVEQRGSVFDPRSVGGWSADPLLLLSPFLLILAVGALLFRFLPPILKLASGAVSAGGGSAAMMLGLWQMTRSPSRYTQLALLVVMAAAVGTFAATYGETTDRSQEERSRFEAGTDARIQTLHRLDRFDGPRIESDLESVPGVTSASGVFRGRSSMGPLPQGGNSLNLLALNPEKASSQLWFRDDFSDEPLSSLMTRLEGSHLASDPLVINDAVGVSVWVNSSLPRANTIMWLRTMDTRGVYFLTELGRLDFSGYRQLFANFGVDLNTMAFPLQIVGLMMTQPSVQDISRGQVTIDDIASFDASGRETVIEDFEGIFRWALLRTPTRARDALDRTTQDVHGGQGAARYSFISGQTTPLRAMYVANPNLPVPGIASKNFLAVNGLRVGTEAEIVIGNALLPVSIQGEVDLFPTMSDSPEGFLVVNGQHLHDFSQLVMMAPPIQPNEAWLTLSSDPQERANAVSALYTRFAIEPRDIVDVQELLGSASNDPVVQAGGKGVLLIAVVAAFAILALGFALTLYLGGQARSVEVSVLRAVGLSPRQVFAMICLEYLLVAIVGLIVGTIAGLRISDTMLGFLDVTQEGTKVLPPFALRTDWSTVVIAIAATGVAFLAGITALAGYFLRLPVSRMLRLTR